MYKKLIASGLTLSMMAVSTSGLAKAEENQIEQKTFTQGADLNINQLNETKNVLGVDGDYQRYKIDSEDVQKYTGKYYDTIFSSTVIEPKKFGHGVDVKIVTPNNITDVTKEQYMNAAITSGIQDANIKVGAVEQTLGYGALSGIYKAYEEEGNALNKEDIQNADEEMQQLSNISKENQGNEDYSDEALNNAVAEIKQEIADQKQNNDNLNQDEVQKIVDDKLRENGLNNLLSDNQINNIYNIMNNVSNSKVMNDDPQAYKDNAKKVAKSIQDNSKDLINKAKNKADELNTDENKNKVVQFFQWLWNIIVSIWNWIISLF